MVHTLWLKQDSKQGTDYSDEYDLDLEQWIGSNHQYQTTRLTGVIMTYLTLIDIEV